MRVSNGFRPHKRRLGVRPTAQMGRNIQCICRELCVTANSGARCPLWVNNGHSVMFDGCPLYPQKRTLELSPAMSALCQKQTYAVQQTAAYSITSSASESTLSEIFMSSAFAVLRLRTNVNLVGCSTGKSAGLAPLRILSTYTAVCLLIS